MMLAHDIASKKEEDIERVQFTIGVRYKVWFVK